MHYGISLQWGPNMLMYNTKTRDRARRAGPSLYNPKYKGKITVPDNPIQIADAALYLEKTKPCWVSPTRTSSPSRSSTPRSRC